MDTNTSFNQSIGMPGAQFQFLLFGPKGPKRLGIFSGKAPKLRDDKSATISTNDRGLQVDFSDGTQQLTISKESVSSVLVSGLRIELYMNDGSFTSFGPVEVLNQEDGLAIHKKASMLPNFDPPKGGKGIRASHYNLMLVGESMWNFRWWFDYFSSFSIPCKLHTADDFKNGSTLI